MSFRFGHSSAPILNQNASGSTIPRSLRPGIHTKRLCVARRPLSVPRLENPPLSHIPSRPGPGTLPDPFVRGWLGDNASAPGTVSDSQRSAEGRTQFRSIQLENSRNLQCTSPPSTDKHAHHIKSLLPAVPPHICASCIMHMHHASIFHRGAARASPNPVHRPGPFTDLDLKLLRPH
jgi:hypothetical protein